MREATSEPSRVQNRRQHEQYEHEQIITAQNELIQFLKQQLQQAHL